MAPNHVTDRRWRDLAARLPDESTTELNRLVDAGLQFIEHSGRPALSLPLAPGRSAIIQPASAGAPAAEAVWAVCGEASATHRTLVDPLPPTGTEGPAAEAAPALSDQYVLIDRPELLAEVVRRLAPHHLVACDTETTGLDPLRDKIRLVQLATPDEVFIVDAFAVGELAPLAPLFAEPSRVFVFQNAKFDVKFLRMAGLDIRSLFDTMLAAQVLDGGLGLTAFGLGDLARTYLQLELDKSQQVSDWSGPLTAEQLSYAARDARVLLALREAMVPQLVRDRLVEAAKLEFDCVLATAEMELAGMGIDQGAWRALGESLHKQRTEAEAALIAELAPALQKDLLGRPLINLDSNPQLLEALQRLGVPIEATDRLVIKPLAGEYTVLQRLLDYRHVAKAITAFSDTLLKHVHPVTGRLHADYRQIGAATGRFSCNRPNLQQIPRTAEYRRCFVPAAGRKLIIADYSQIELRIVAQMAQDERMIEAYRSGEDLHRLTASIVSERPIEQVGKAERQAAKAINFGLIYAMGAKGLATYAQNTYGVDLSEEEAERFRTRFFAAYAGVARWHERGRREQLQETRTLAGRVRRFANPSLTAAYNAPVQGTSADITKRALAALYGAFAGTATRLVGTVHDEILVETPEADAQRVCEQVTAQMVAAGEAYLRDVPVEVEAHVAASWAEK
ncbi:MAG TPA: bifunctional 3'-5' exonuclease/DNA polymerase [Limnochordia bacterium]|nr:bifunctional 3'-5' exonuclease/DNA polymerase [Limnochordia bacterium]